MPWVVPDHPHTPSFTAEAATVQDALVTPFHRGIVHATTGPATPRLWMTGAVHDGDGELVHQSLRSWSGDQSAPVAVDPQVGRAGPKTGRLRGHWRYGGHWSGHFGHFFIEVLTTLWDDRGDVSGVLCHQSFRVQPPTGEQAAMKAAAQTPWQVELLKLAGYGDLPVRIVRQRPVRVDALSVSERPVLLKSWAAPQAVEVWQRISQGVGTSGNNSRVFLSRSRFNAHENRRKIIGSAAWDQHLDAEFARSGFEVVYPEMMTISEQIALIRGAEVIAGSAGSNLHLSAFATAGTRVLEVGDARTPDTTLPTQQMIDAACGHPTNFVRYQDGARLRRVLRHL
jgi:hypothetical protein